MTQQNTNTHTGMTTVTTAIRMNRMTRARTATAISTRRCSTPMRMCRTNTTGTGTEGGTEG